MYQDDTYSYTMFERFFFEKNLQGDIVAVYNEFGEKIGSYYYDAWGNHTVVTESGNNSFEDEIVNNYNPFRYRGYYYDIETGFYYLQSRYYNPEWGRFLNPDSIMAGASGTLHGHNLYVYCFNNPIMMDDAGGNWPKWLKKLGNTVKKRLNDIKDTAEKAIKEDLPNVLDAFFSSFEGRIGAGLGIGGNLSDTFMAELSHHIYVGFDDGQLITGTTTTQKVSVAEIEFLEFGNVKDLVSERGTKRVEEYTSPDPIIAVGPMQINEKGELVFSGGGSLYLGGGGHASLSFNVSEFIRRLYD